MNMQFDIGQSSVFVGDLSTTCTEGDLFSLFAKCCSESGIQSFSVETVKIQRCLNAGTSLGYGFVGLTSMECANYVREKLDGYYLFGRYLKVREAGYGMKGATGHKERVEEAEALKSFHSLYLRFWTTNRSFQMVNEELIREIYEDCGDIDDVSIRKLTIDKNSGLQHGYGFIHYKDSEIGLQAALNAYINKSQVVFEHAIFFLELSKNLQKQLSRTVEGRQILALKSSQNQSNYPNIQNVSVPQFYAQPISYQQHPTTQRFEGAGYPQAPRGPVNYAYPAQLQPVYANNMRSAPGYGVSQAESHYPSQQIPARRNLNMRVAPGGMYRDSAQYSDYDMPPKPTAGPVWHNENPQFSKLRSNLVVNVNQINSSRDGQLQRPVSRFVAEEPAKLEGTAPRSHTQTASTPEKVSAKSSDEQTEESLPPPPVYNDMSPPDPHVLTTVKFAIGSVDSFDPNVDDSRNSQCSTQGNEAIQVQPSTDSEDLGSPKSGRSRTSTSGSIGSSPTSAMYRKRSPRVKGGAFLGSGYYPQSNMIANAMYSAPYPYVPVDYAPFPMQGMPPPAMGAFGYAGYQDPRLSGGRSTLKFSPTVRSRKQQQQHPVANNTLINPGEEEGNNQIEQASSKNEPEKSSEY